MLLKFDKIISKKDTIDISFDGGATWESFNNDDVLQDGIYFTEEDCDNNFSNIKIKGQFTSLSDLSVKINTIDVNDLSSTLGDLEFKRIGCSDILVLNPGTVNGIDLGVTPPLEDSSIIPPGYYRFSTTISNVELPETIKEIGDEAFRCSSVRNVTITLPDSEDFYLIGSHAFADCHFLERVTINTLNPDKMYFMYLDGFTFEWCQNLEEFNVPENVKIMGYFQDTFKATSIRNLDLRTFTDCPVSLPSSSTSMNHRNYIDIKSYVKNGQTYYQCPIYSAFLIPNDRDLINIKMNNSNINQFHITSSNICSRLLPSEYNYDTGTINLFSHYTINPSAISYRSYEYNVFPFPTNSISSIEFYGSQEECDNIKDTFNPIICGAYLDTWSYQSSENESPSNKFGQYITKNANITYIVD